ncbi:MAG: hypothetical protein ABEJ27_02575 [Halodesulfurarchaeum sp.]
MPRKTKANIERWVEAAVPEALEETGASPDSVTATYEQNAGHYERVSVAAPNLDIPPDEHFSATVEGMTIEFQALESEGGDEQPLRVKVS